MAHVTAVAARARPSMHTRADVGEEDAEGRTRRMPETVRDEHADPMAPGAHPRGAPKEDRTPQRSREALGREAHAPRPAQLDGQLAHSVPRTDRADLEP